MQAPRPMRNCGHSHGRAGDSEGAHKAMEIAWRVIPTISDASKSCSVLRTRKSGLGSIWSSSDVISRTATWELTLFSLKSTMRLAIRARPPTRSVSAADFPRQFGLAAVDPDSLIRESQLKKKGPLEGARLVFAFFDLGRVSLSRPSRMPPQTWARSNNRL